RTQRNSDDFARFRVGESENIDETEDLAIPRSEPLISLTHKQHFHRVAGVRLVCQLRLGLQVIQANLLPTLQVEKQVLQDTKGPGPQSVRLLRDFIGLQDAQQRFVHKILRCRRVERQALRIGQQLRM